MNWNRIVFFLIIPLLGGIGFYMYWKKNPNPHSSALLAKAVSAPTRLLAQVAHSTMSEAERPSENHKALRLTGLLYSKSRAMARINEACLGVGEVSSIRLSSAIVKLRCLNIASNSVTVQVDDTPPRVLMMVHYQ